MAITKYILSIIILMTSVNLSDAQTYDIKSLNGEIEKVKVISDYSNNIITISSLNDIIHIADFTDMESVTVLDGCFLEIIYSIRGGSDESLQYLLLISIKNNKLYQAAHVPSLLKYDVDKVYNKKADSLKLFDEHGDYGLDVDITGADKANYKLVINVHDKIKSKHDPKTNHNSKEQVSLSFDPINYIFYNAHESISQYFTIYDPKIQRAIKQYVLGTFPVIQLGSYKYYYIKDEWYGKGHDDKLLKYTYK